MAHNAGYDDAKFGRVNRPTCMLPAYKRYMKQKKKSGNRFSGVNFYGDNIKCLDKDPHVIYNDRCGGHIANQTQHYGYGVVAKHLLAVCYYAKNFGNEPLFEEWRKKYIDSGGYCNLLPVPDVDDLNVEK